MRERGREGGTLSALLIYIFFVIVVVVVVGLKYSWRLESLVIFFSEPFLKRLSSVTSLRNFPAFGGM